jgi:hypothetical protein
MNQGDDDECLTNNKDAVEDQKIYKTIFHDITTRLACCCPDRSDSKRPGKVSVRTAE